MALYQRKEVAQYTDAEDLFDALACTVEGQHSVRLVRMSWLLQQRGSVLRRRQELPEEEAGGRGGCGKVAPMIAMSFCWDAREHPDPEGLQMNLVIATLEQERGTYSQTDGEFAGFSEMGVCWDCPSLLHGDPDKAHEAHAQEAADDAKRTPAEKAAFKHVLHETIDLWYAHQARTVFLLTQHLREWGSTRECGYDQSGWTTCWPVGPARLEFEGMPPPTPEQVAGLGGCLRLCARLEKLDLRRCNVGPAGWESLARTLPSAPRLEELYLQDKGIGGDGAEALAQALPSTLGLEYLDLSGNGIGGDGAEAALRAAWGRRNLDYLARGVGRELGIPAGDVVVASVFYDLFAAADSPLRGGHSLACGRPRLAGSLRLRGRCEGAEGSEWRCAELREVGQVVFSGRQLRACTDLCQADPGPGIVCASAPLCPRARRLARPRVLRPRVRARVPSRPGKL
ncbi:unnamed protein product [Prorocentrum cordatum]|uniref:Uncharacterized protein n=1 Tax=Prorocentrum cordatum TaxID=2364126 RepID=A0ABN9QXJ9_9DINO|nr:unnamed protein product [Polarella glacialis]